MTSDNRDSTHDGNAGDRPTDFALEYVARGWSVFPVPPNTKKSHKSAKNTNGNRRWGMTNDANEIRQDFARWPKAGIGIPTGEVNGIFVVEADTMEGHGVDGIAAMQRLEEENSPLPVTLMAESPTGSIHRYFKWPGTKVKSFSIVHGVDCKGDGGMVVAPPTRTKKGAYRWINPGTPIADAPQWLIDLVTLKKRPVVVWSNMPPADLGEVADALAVIPNDDNVSWDDWNKIGMILWRGTGGSDDGFALFGEWSKKCGEKYNEINTRKKWDLFSTCPPDRIGLGTLFYLASQIDPAWRDKAEDAAWQRFCNRGSAP